MRFLVDVQLPPALSRALRNEGHQADHLEDVGLRPAKDADIWNYALENKAVIVKDEDFVDRYRRLGDGPVIVWVRIGNSSTQIMLGWFMRHLPALLHRLNAGDKLVELR